MAGSIKLFRVVQKYHQTFFGIYPRQPNSKKNQLSSNSIRAIFLISYAQFMFTTFAFLLFDAKSMFHYGFVFFLLVTITNAIAIYLIFVWQSENTLEFVENCEGFIEKRAQSTAAYIELIGKIERFNTFLYFGMFTTISIFLMVGPFCFVRYYIFDLGENSFYLFFPAWFPFDWKTPFGYFVAWLAQCAGNIAVGSIVGQFSTLVFGSCWLFVFIAEDITQDVVAFNIATKTASNKNRTELMKRFCDMVQIYSDAKQCIIKFNHTFKYSLFAFFAWDMLSVSSVLVTIQFDLWADHSNLFEISFLTLILHWLAIFLLLLCEPGERIANQLVEFSDELNQSDWYLLPIELQQWFIIFLSDTQNPRNVSSYANITCERETLKKIFNTAFSYFMAFRRVKTLSV